MESITSLLSIALGAVLVNNFVLSQFLGICPFMGVSKKIDTAVGMGAAVTFVMGLASALCYPVNKLLDNLGLGFMQTVAFILVIAGLVQFVEMFLNPPPVRRSGRVPSPDHYQLRRSGRGSAEHSEQLQLRRFRDLWHHRRSGLPAGYLPVCGCP